MTVGGRGFPDFMYHEGFSRSLRPPVEHSPKSLDPLLRVLAQSTLVLWGARGEGAWINSISTCPPTVPGWMELQGAGTNFVFTCLSPVPNVPKLRGTWTHLHPTPTSAPTPRSPTPVGIAMLFALVADFLVGGA